MCVCVNLTRKGIWYLRHWLAAHWSRPINPSEADQWGHLYSEVSVCRLTCRYKRIILKGNENATIISFTWANTCLVFSNQQSKTPKYSVYNDVKLRKAPNAHIKDALRSFGEDILIRPEWSSFIFRFIKLNNQTLFGFYEWINWTNKLTLKDNTVYTVLLCLFVADPATFLASDSVLVPYSPLRAACLVTYVKKKKTQCLFHENKTRERLEFYLHEKATEMMDDDESTNPPIN